MIVFLLSSHSLLCCSSHLKHNDTLVLMSPRTGARAHLLCGGTANVYSYLCTIHMFRLPECSITCDLTPKYIQACEQDSFHGTLHPQQSNHHMTGVEACTVMQRREYLQDALGILFNFGIDLCADLQTMGILLIYALSLYVTCTTGKLRQCTTLYIQ